MNALESDSECDSQMEPLQREIVELRMPGRGTQHMDLAVSDVDRSLAFHMDVLGPLGLEEERYPTCRGT